MIVKLKKEERLLNAYCIEYMYCGIIFIRGSQLHCSWVAKIFLLRGNVISFVAISG